ncbi:MAG TPA: ATP-binding protein [Myxococcales bacterium]|nr:ATP-binding protein [Myxococcales bacterium]
MARPAPTSTPQRPSESNALARLALAEQLIASDDAAECAQRAVDWLARRAAAKAAVCALVDPETDELRALAGFGITPAQLKRLSVHRDEGAHPVAFALSGPTPIVFANGKARGPPPLGPGPFVAVPLPIAERPEARVGILLAAPPSPELEREARWLADALGQKLVHLRAMRRAVESEHRLQRERELLLSVINSVPDPVLLTDTEGRIIISNSRADALFVARDEQSEGRQRAVTLNNMLFSAALSSQAIDEPEAARRELLLVNPTEGTDLLFELLSTTVQHPREGTGFVSILRNVTDLRAATEQIEENYRKLRIAEADVRAERDRLDLVIDSVADPILVTDPSGKILLMNAPAERLFTAPEGSGDDMQRAVRTNDAHFSSFVSNVFLSGGASRFRGEISLADPQAARPLPVEAISGKVLSEHGEVTAVVTILHDHTEALDKARLYEQLERASKELQEKVREATAELVRRNELLQRQAIELEQASQLKSQFLANMSHEFRTPLNAILGYTSMLLQGVNGEMTPPQQKNLGRVDSNAKHLLNIINDLLDISRIEAGKMPLHLEQFELPTLLGELLAEVEPLIQKARLSATTELTGDLPAVQGDRQKVKQIVLNLLTNAIKFTPQGAIRVSAGYDATRDEISLAVKDSGIGIAENDQQKIFDDFRQADDSVTRQYGGAGLGLSICRRLANMLAGRITVESKLGAGSTFTLHVPREGRRP